MSSLLRPALLVGACLVLALPCGLRAHAQTKTGTQPVGTCTGTVTASIGFAAYQHQGDATLTTVSQTYAPQMFGRAECDCNTNDVAASIQISAALPAGTVTTVTGWVGSGCEVYATRVNTSAVQCRQFMSDVLTSTAFNAGSGYTVSNPLNVPIPARALFDPASGSCDTNRTNKIYIFIGTDQTAPGATCTVSVGQQATGASAAYQPSTESGEGAVSVNWSVAPVGTVGYVTPAFFQVLCADEDGNPLLNTDGEPGTSRASDSAYSTCTDSGIQRRQQIFGASGISGTTDGGTTSADMTVASTSFGLQQSGAGPSASPHADQDMGTDMAGVDMSGTTFTSQPRVTDYPALGPFRSLDPKFICTPYRDAALTNFSERIDHLENNKKYQFVILAIDAYGNAVPSDLMIETPKPVDDLYNRYRASGGTAQGFCFVATAAYGDYDHPQVRVLRAFRDHVLESSSAGHALVRAYYASSPPLARFIAASDLRRSIARAALWPLVGVAMLALELHSLALALMLVVGVPGLVTVLWRRRTRRRRALVEVAA